MRSTMLLGLALLVGCGGGDGPALIVGPAGANTFDDLFVQVDDKDPARWDYSWTVDEVELEGETGQTISSELTNKGELWTVTVSRGNLSSSASIEIGNAAPSAEVSITPSSPTASDDIEADGIAIDPDNDPAFVDYSWQKYDDDPGDDSPPGWQPSTFKSTRLPATATRRGERWRVVVTPNDGETTGPQGFLEFEISNGEPLITELVLNRYVATTNDTLVVTTATATDPDGDFTTIDYQWVLNGTEVAGQTGNRFDGSAEDGFDAGDEVYVKVRAVDNGPGPWRASPIVQVVNGPPSAPEAEIQPTEPLEDEDLLCVVSTEAVDPDPGDTVNYRAEWYVDGAPYTSAGDSTFDGDTVSSDATEIGETWECVLVAEDALGNASAASASVSIGARSGCADGTTEVEWNFDTVGCVATDQDSWANFAADPATVCASGWEMAGSDVVNTVLAGPGYTADLAFAFNGEGCDGYDSYATTNDSRFRRNSNCLWRKSHHQRVDETEDLLDGIMCVRSEPEP